MATSSALTRDKLYEIARTLPTSPRVLAGLSELLADINAGLDEVASLIKRDGPLAARLLRVSNSVAYAGAGAMRIGAVEEAVNRVGFSEVYRLVGAITSDRLSERSLVFYDIKPQTLREHMLFAALAAEMLAEECGEDPRMAYTAGLLRPLGMLVLDRVAEHLTNCERYDKARYGDYRFWEGVMFGVPNPEVACMVLESWRFPPDIVSPIREHYLTRATDMENKRAVLVNLACSIVSDCGYGLEGDQRFWDYSQQKLDALGLENEQYRNAKSRAEELFERLRAGIE